MTIFREVGRKVPPLRRVVKQRRRRKLAYSYYRPKLAAIDRWLDESVETTNFTYELTDLSVRYLIAFVAEVTGTSRANARRYVDELHGDDQLRQHIEDVSRSIPDADVAARYGRRAGWYAVARTLKPNLIVETGVEKGLGACVLSTALLRNAQEGHPGRYVGTDIDPQAGRMLSAEYATVGEILYGDSIKTLRTLDGPIGLFVNDSDHSAEYEAAEYAAMATKLAGNAIVLGDNAHVTDELLRFADATDRRFLYWQEFPANHWYPGGGIGAAFQRK